MSEMNEELALSIVFANTKRKKRRVDLLTLAQSCEYLIDLYGNRKKLAQEIGLSSEMIRNFLLILNFPPEVQSEVKNRNLDSLDVIKQLATIKDPNQQIRIAKMAKNLTTKDIRDIIRVTKNSSFSENEAKEIVMNSKPKGLNVFIIDLEDEYNKVVISESKNLSLKPGEYIKRLVKEKLNEKLLNPW